MAGHSKWANIQHRKGAQDKKRGKLFTKLIREVTIAARTGGADLAANPRLRVAVDKAKTQSMPKENIERAIKRGAGDLDGVHYQDVTYEGYGPGGVAVIVQCMTDNRNRTVAEVRHAFSKFGGNLGADGSVAYMFNQVGLLSVEPGANEERVMEIAIDAGAEDVIVNADRSIDVLTDPADYNTVKDAMDHAGLRLELAEVTLRSSVATELGEKEAESMLKLLEMLEDLEDVQNVYSNAEIPDDVLARVSGFQGQPG